MGKRKKKKSIIHSKYEITHYVKTKKGKFRVVYNKAFDRTRISKQKGITKAYHEILFRKGDQINKFKKLGLDKIFKKHGFKK